MLDQGWFQVPCRGPLGAWHLSHWTAREVPPLLLFYETHITAFRLEEVTELILGQPLPSIEEIEAHNLEWTQPPANRLSRVGRKLNSHSRIFL